jgi:hypothetical protein
MLSILLFVACFTLLHEIGHLFVTEYYGVTKALCFSQKRGSILTRVFTTGMVVTFRSEGLTRRQQWTIALFPLVFLPIGAALLWFGWHTLGAVFAVAGGMVFLSDVPLMYFDATSEESFILWKLVAFDDETDALWT